MMDTAHPFEPVRLEPVRVWDLPLRLFHWTLVSAVAAAIASGLAGGDWMGLHAVAGQAIAALLVFRLAWGVLGSTHARFASFWPTPRRLRDYLQGRWDGAGHNPLGALSVLALLLLLALQVATGLAGNDEIAFVGPWAHWVSDDLSLRLTGWHRVLSKLLFGWLALHLLAIAWHEGIRRSKLLAAMLSGRKHTHPDHAARGGGIWALVVALTIAGGAALALRLSAGAG